MDPVSKKQELLDFINKYPLLIIGIFFTFIVIIKIILTLNFKAPFIYMDEIFYDSLAQNLKDGKFYANVGGTYPPGYPLLLSLAYWVSSDKVIIYHIMLAISSIITTSIIFPSYLLLKKYCDNVIAILGSLAVAVLPFMTFYSFTIMTEALFIPLFLCSILFIINSYETNNKKWELLASFSVVYLYITRSNGISILIAFVLTFVYYIIVKSDNNNILDLIKKKSFLMSSFIIFLMSWIIFSTYITDIGNLFSGQQGVSQVSQYNVGSAYNISDLSGKMINNALSLNGLLDGLKYFINSINYLLLASSLMLFIALFFCIILILNKKSDKKSSLSISIIYLITVASLLIISTVGFLIWGITHEVILGRYLEPLLPPIIILGIIFTSKMDNKIINSKNANLFVISFIVTIFIALFAIMYNNTIILAFMNMVDNPAFYSLTQFYDPFFGINYGFVLQMPITAILPATLMLLFYLLILACIYLSFNNKKYLALLLVIFIISSVDMSQPLYYNSVFQSRMCDGGQIGTFLNAHTNKDTIFLIENNQDRRSETCFYGFWNKGEVIFVDSNNTTTLNRYNSSTAYLISTKPFNYTIVSTDDPYKVYKL